MDTWIKTEVTRLRENGAYERFVLDDRQGETFSLEAHTWSLMQLVDGKLVEKIFPIRSFVGATISHETVEATNVVEPALASA